MRRTIERLVEGGVVDDPAHQRRLAASGLPLPIGRETLRALLGTYLDRAPVGLSPLHRYDHEPTLDPVHFAWAGSTTPGQPHYYRLQGPRLLIEWDNTQRNANHAHSVWRDPTLDFGLDVLARHRAAHHV